MMKVEVLSRFSGRINGVLFDNETIFKSTDEFFDTLVSLNPNKVVTEELVKSYKDALEEEYNNHEWFSLDGFEADAEKVIQGIPFNEEDFIALTTFKDVFIKWKNN